MRGPAMLAAVASLLGGCSSLQAVNPVNWWHRQEGGKIAEQRPAPPGADQPYPNIATVPAKPDAPDAEALSKLTASLVADRTNAQHAAQSAPLADPSSPTASPDLFGVGTAPPPPPASPRGAGTASASLPAVTAPPAPAPRKTVQSAPLEAPPVAPAATSPVSPAPGVTASPGVAASPGGAASPGAVAATAPAPNEAASSAPGLPEAPPPRPGIAGAPPPAQAIPTPMPAPPAGASATIVFPEQTTSLSQPATEEVKAFATKRGNGTISVTGYGDSTSNDPDAQSAALNRGLSRARSIEEALKAAGVPGAAIRISAEASGRGASLHLLQ